METITDEELTRQALSAELHPVIDPGALPWRGAGESASSILPDWYMPSAHARRRGPVTRATVLVLIASFVAINALGLCVTYGVVSIA